MSGSYVCDRHIYWVYFRALYVSANFISEVRLHIEINVLCLKHSGFILMASVSQCQNKFFIEFHTGVRSISHPPLTPESAQEKTDLLAIIMIFFFIATYLLSKIHFQVKSIIKLDFHPSLFAFFTPRRHRKKKCTKLDWNSNQISFASWW